MATTGGAGAVAGGGPGGGVIPAPGGGAPANPYVGMTAPPQQRSDELSQARSDAVWAAVYRATGAGSEADRRAVRLATYVAFGINGTTREGSYDWPVVDSNGRSYEASVLVNAAGRFSIRKFFRTNMADSYLALKTTRALLENERYVAKMEAVGIDREHIHATPDWMTDNPQFSVVENLAHERARVAGFAKADKSRRGHSLEAIEENRAMATVVGESEVEHGVGTSALVPGGRPVW